MSHRRLGANVPIVRSNSLTRITHPHGASDDRDINQQGRSWVQVLPRTSAVNQNQNQQGRSGASALQEVNQNQQQTYQRPTRSEYSTLYRAALKGNWKDARAVLDRYPDAIRYTFKEARGTILHIASASKHTAFVKEVVRLLNKHDLEKKNIDGSTALGFAAQIGIVTIAKEMVKKNVNLPCVHSSEGLTPLHIAALLGRKDMVSYLFSVTPMESLLSEERMEIFVATITHDFYDIALKILENDSNLATSKDGMNIAALRDLARKPVAQLPLMERCLKYFCFKGIHHKTKMQKLVQELFVRISKKFQLFEDRQFTYIFRTVLFDAAKFGNAEFLDILIQSYPDIVWITDVFHRSLFHIAVINRQEGVFNLIYETIVPMEIILTYVDAYKQNILHLAATLAPPSRLNLVAGAALQMHRELLWFKEVEKIVPPSYLKMRNYENLTPWDVFTKEHKDLRTEGEKWMKDTVNFYIVVATLITGVAFAAAFTIPGGSHQDKGTPIFLKSIWFSVFFISDAIALLFSSMSILLFLSILSSRFKEMDFLVSLPLKLEFGVSALFTSIAGMLVAFIATSYLVFKSEMTRLPIVINALAGVPITLFFWLHYKLWAEIIHSTNWLKFIFRQLKN